MVSQASCTFSGGVSTFNNKKYNGGVGYLSSTERNGQWEFDGPPPQVGEVTDSSYVPSDAKRSSILDTVDLSRLWTERPLSRAPSSHYRDPGNGNGERCRPYPTLLRSQIFFVFGITGFFHAPLLRPWPLTVVGVAATSTLINTVATGFPWPTIDLWVLFLTIIVIQTIAIGLGSVMGERMTTLSEQRRQALAQLEAARDENAGLQAQLVTQAREAGMLDERQRMAREIHDTLAQGLTGIITQLEAVKQAVDRPRDWQRHLDNAVQLARDSLAEARRSVEASRPELLEGEGARLPEALESAARQWSALNGTQVDVATTGEPQPLDTEIEVALLRTAQEALVNVSKHAHASRVGVTLSYMGDVVTLDVRDDGIGFDVPDAVAGRGAGFGLTAMRQRVNRVAGTLAVESEPGGGTAISARVPAILAQTASGSP